MNIIIGTINLPNGWASLIEGVETSVFKMIKHTFLAANCGATEKLLPYQQEIPKKCYSQLWLEVQESKIGHVV